MFGIGWSELLVILALALLVIGPKDLPRVLYAAGKFIRKIKTFTGDIQHSLENIMRDEELEDITRNANKAGGDNLQFELEKQIQAEEARKRAGQDQPDELMSPLPPQPEITPEDDETTGDVKSEVRDARG